MGILSRIKAIANGMTWASRPVTNIDPLLRAQTFANMNLFLGAKPRPFNYSAVVSMCSTSWAGACIEINATAVSQVPLRLYVKKPAGRQKMAFPTRPVSKIRKAWLRGENKHKPGVTVQMKSADMGDDFEELVGPSPILALLRSVNPVSNGFDFLKLQAMYLESVGNTYFMPVFDKRTGLPCALYPLMAQWVQVLPGVKGQDYVVGYRYGIGDNTGASSEDFERDQVIHIKRPNPNSLYYGLGKGEIGWQALCLNQANHTMDLAFSDNMNRPDFVASIKDAQTGDVLNRFVADMQKLFRGSANAGKFLAVNGDTTITPLNYKPKDMNGREENVEEIAAVFGTPCSMLLANDPNKAGAETAIAQWKTQTVGGNLNLIQDALNQSYLPLWGEEVAANSFLAFDDPIAIDDQVELDAMMKQVGGKAIITINEARARIDLPPIDGGDELMPENEPDGDEGSGGKGKNKPKEAA